MPILPGFPTGHSSQGASLRSTRWPVKRTSRLIENCRIAPIAFEKADRNADSGLVAAGETVPELRVNLAAGSPISCPVCHAVRVATMAERANVPARALLH